MSSPLVAKELKDATFNLTTLIEQSPNVLQRMLDASAKNRDDPRWPEIVEKTNEALQVMRDMVTLCGKIERGEQDTESLG